MSQQTRLQEVENFGKAASLDTHKALVHIFFAQRSTKKVRGVTDSGLAPRPVRTLAVLGGGLMGSGIATASLLASVTVILKEVNEKFLEVRHLGVRYNRGCSFMAWGNAHDLGMIGVLGI